MAKDQGTHVTVTRTVKNTDQTVIETYDVRLSPTVAAALSTNAELRRRQLAYIGETMIVRRILDGDTQRVDCELMHHDRLAKALRLIAEGWADVFFMMHVTRGAPELGSVKPEDRHLYTVEIRPAKGGKWSKPVVTRCLKDAAEHGRLGVTGPAPVTDEERVAADFREATTPAPLAG